MIFSISTSFLPFFSTDEVIWGERKSVAKVRSMYTLNVHMEQVRVNGESQKLEVGWNWIWSATALFMYTSCLKFHIFLLSSSLPYSIHTIFLFIPTHSSHYFKLYSRRVEGVAVRNYLSIRCEECLEFFCEFLMHAIKSREIKLLNMRALKIACLSHWPWFLHIYFSRKILCLDGFFYCLPHSLNHSFEFCT